MKTNNEGDKYVDLGRKRRATVRAFKGSNPLHLASAYAVTDDLLPHLTGKPLLDIREYYGQEGDENPGKKGIALNQEEVRVEIVYLFTAAHATVVGETQSERVRHRRALQEGQEVKSLFPLLPMLYFRSHQLYLCPTKLRAVLYLNPIVSAPTRLCTYQCRYASPAAAMCAPCRPPTA